MKRGKLVTVFCLIMIAVLLFAGCGKKDQSTASNEVTANDEMYQGAASTADADYGVAVDGTDAEVKFSVADSLDTTAVGTSTDTEESSPVEESTGKADGLNNSAAVSSDTLNASPQNKIIQNFYLDVETKDFDNLISEIDTQIKSLGGYVESSQISGTSFYNEKGTRTGNIVARIPSEKAGEFVNKIDEAANIVNNQKTTKNVSLEYIDAQSRIETLKIEQERLFAILEKTEDLESIITLESRLSEIRYELQNYESQLRTYDNQVEYSTVSLNIKEVERMTPVVEVKQTFAGRIKNGFSDTIYNLTEGFKNFIVWFIVNLPYLLIWGAILLLAAWIVRRIMKKEKEKKHSSPSVAGYGQISQGHYQNNAYQGQQETKNEEQMERTEDQSQEKR